MPNIGLLCRLGRSALAATPYRASSRWRRAFLGQQLQPGWRSGTPWPIRAAEPQITVTLSVAGYRDAQPLALKAAGARGLQARRSSCGWQREALRQGAPADT